MNTEQQISYYKGKIANRCAHIASLNALVSEMRFEIGEYEGKIRSLKQPPSEAPPLSSDAEVKCSKCGTTEKVYRFGVEGSDVKVQLCMDCLRKEMAKPSEAEGGKPPVQGAI